MDIICISKGFSSIGIAMPLLKIIPECSALLQCLYKIF